MSTLYFLPLLTIAAVVRHCLYPATTLTMRVLQLVILLQWLAHIPACLALIVPLLAANPALSLKGITLQRLSDGESIDLGEALSLSGKTMLVLGSHPADFNLIEYAQKVRVFWPQMKVKGIERCIIVMNGEKSSCRKLAELLELPDEIEILPDPTGESGRQFGVSRGWRPDDDRISPILKTTVVGLGFGPPWGTLPAVLTGYIGNPNGRREWIEESLKQGQLFGRWPQVLDIADDGNVVGNKFDDFPLLSGWGRRPFELATLRLQNLVDIQIKHWDELKPVDDRCLTQLGGCTIVSDDGVPIYSWLDTGLCDIPDFDKLLSEL